MLDERKEFLYFGIYLCVVTLGAALSFGVWGLHKNLFWTAVFFALYLAPALFFLSGVRTLTSRWFGTQLFLKDGGQARQGYSRERAQARAGLEEAQAAVRSLKWEYFWKRDVDALERAVELCLGQPAMRFEGLRLAHKLRTKLKPHEREHLERRLRTAFQANKPAMVEAEF